MYTLYSMQRSGNCYKARLALAQLGIPYQIVDLDILKGETRTPDFLAMNPNGKIPLLELDDGSLLPESNAILGYLAEGSRFVPAGRLPRARTLQWMFFEQYSHEPYIAVMRFWLRYSGTPEQFADQLDGKMKGGYAALDALERGLSGHDFLVGDRYSIADVSLYAYTHVAHEGEFDLDPYTAIRAWLERIASQSGHVTIDA